MIDIRRDDQIYDMEGDWFRVRWQFSIATQGGLHPPAAA